MMKFPLMQVMELACSAYRTNNGYLKDDEAVYDKDGKFMFIKPTNKMLIQLTLNIGKWPGEQKDHPALLKISQEDQELAAEIKKYFRRLLFAAIDGTNEFHVNLNSILGQEEIESNKIGYVACLPHVYKKDYAKNTIEKRIHLLDTEYLGEPGDTVIDLDCEILESIKSKNYEAFNICAIINNKMVSWMSKNDLKVGPCVVIKANVKDHQYHWKHKNPVTRLNYVKAFQ